MKKFIKKYGLIENVSALRNPETGKLEPKEWFTNSIHVPVYDEINPFEKIDVESQLTGYSSAGCITYVELDDSAKNNTNAVEQIIIYAMEHDIPYFAVNVPSDTCLNCGYTDEIGDCCPKCGCNSISRLRRVTGYLTGDYKSAFNFGKQKEAEHRYKHSNKLSNWNKK